ncbi:hypothetical protein [Saccharothrix coeruleofusca]|uniref:Uncharacterized protein n=1 Tax=Saccharothrix coeruleofusca TaxID=33919 RepID=A0A918EHT7_9PSEU|nr:hypothetical protein [Saccharothrix coeruleofusca]MBP2339739.1 hypothetical protein [Saccharothrix coeruleofusca]GGP80492.1 hypothetical protein GCM10010185_62950 [Saccharothrix coeruleofusca]
MAEHSSPFTAGPGGVMTDEVGVVTGALELRTTVDEECVLTAWVRYEGADEWYRVTGGACALVAPEDHEPVHALLLGVLNRPEG